LVFLGTPDIASYCLKSLIDDEHFKVTGVLTQPDRPAGRNMKLQASPVKQLAVAESLPVLTPEKLTPEILEQIKEWKAEAAVVVAYGQILPQSFLDLFPKKVVNVHASLLPRWRGAAPIQRALMAGDEETGVSLQVVVKKLDAGDVLGARKLKTEGLDALQMLEKMKPLAADLLSIEFMDYLRGNLTPSPQDESKVTYAHKIEKSEGRVDWTLPASEIERRLRGLKMGPGSSTLRQGKTLKLHRVETLSASGKPGHILKADAQGIVVAAGEGAVRVTELQPESRGRMAASEYLKGQKVETGEVWGE
jgi:methionyl-tRNA formyltransferase